VLLEAGLFADSMKQSSQGQLNAFSQRVRYVFLDRDGVINRKRPEGEYVDCWNRFDILSGVESAIATLNHSGRRVIVVSNQRGVALGLYTCAEVDKLHCRLQEHLASYGAEIDAIYYCPHDENQCECRKPKPGLFYRAFHDFPDASALNSVMIGDSISDIEVARKLGIRAIFVQGDPRTMRPGSEAAKMLADGVANSLADAVDRYLP
jgi:D-glycero-D-manno-heptose 1,7-bisphosphate phosphatase